MTTRDTGPKDSPNLRRQAEEQIRSMEPSSFAAQTPEEIQRVFHELRVHQIELEMQNEELRRAQAEIEAGRERYFDLYNLAPVGYCTLSEKGLILEANLTAATLLGCARSKLMRQPISRFILKDDQDIFYLHRKQLFETGEAQECELRLVKADGGIFWAHLTGTAVQAEDGAPVCRLVISNINGRKEAEESNEKLQALLTQAQKMESVGRLAGGVAHDFNNMLGVILGNVELCLDIIGPDDPVHADLEEIRKAAQRSAALTRQLLAFARKQTIAPRVLDLNKTVDGMLNMLRRLIGEDINLVWKPGEGLWPVKMDSTQIDQILANLCVNARDAIAGVGRVCVETRYIVVEEKRCAQQAGVTPGDYVMLSVGDDGCGIDAQTLLLVFDPFFTTKQMGKGTGLGLATVYGIVRQNNGFINVNSEPGQGTTFYIYLPRHISEKEFLPKQTPAKAGGSDPKTILLVEDEPAILKMTTIILERQGYTVLAVRTPGEAIRRARECACRIDLLITDVIMPEMNGRDLARNLLSVTPGLKCLFMSGYAPDIITHYGVQDESEHFIQKPFSLDELMAKLRKVLEG